jgi:hypothetical protein
LRVYRSRSGIESNRATARRTTRRRTRGDFRSGNGRDAHDAGKKRQFYPSQAEQNIGEGARGYLAGAEASMGEAEGGAVALAKAALKGSTA